MNDSSNKRAVIVGIFIFIGIVFFLIGILSIGNLHETFKKKIMVQAVFDDVNGLQKGNNVWCAGLKIGTVSKLDFFGNDKVKVEFKVEEAAIEKIRKNAFVKLSTDGLIGNKILVIYGGTANSPHVEEGDMLGVEKTFTSEDMINTLQENNKNILAITDDFKVVSANLSQGKGTVGKLLTDETLYSQLTSTGNSLQLASNKAQQLMGSLNAFSAGLNKKGSLANQLVTDTVVFNSLRATVQNLQQVSDSASAVVASVNQSLNDSDSPLGAMLNDKKTGDHLKATMKNLESSTKKLDEDLEGLQHSFLLRRYFKKHKSDTTRVGVQ